MNSATFSIPTEQPKFTDILRAMPEIVRIAIRADKRAFWILVGFTMLDLPLSAFYVYAIGHLTQALVEKDSDTVNALALGFLAYTVVASVRYLVITRNLETQQLALKQMLHEELKLLLLKLPARTLEDAGFQSLLDAYRRKLHVGQESLQRLRMMLASVAGLTGIATSFAIIPWEATMILMLALIVQAVLAARASRKHWYQLLNDSREGRRMNYFEQNMESAERLMQLRNISAEHGFFKSWKELAIAVMKRQRDSMKATSLAEGAYEVIEGIAFVVGIMMIVGAVMTDRSALAVFPTFVAGFRDFAGRFHTLNQQINWLKQEGQFFVLFKRVLGIPTEPDAGEEVPNGELDIMCSRVSFRYGEGQPFILDKLDLAIRAGERVAIVGPNGAGKTTLIKLLSRIYQPTKGIIMADGTDIWSIKPSAWQRAVSALMQKRWELSDTIKNQVLYASQNEPGAPDRYTLAVETSQLAGVIREKPKGDETFAGKWGAMPEDSAIELSGGERQMLAIAQSLHKDARIYIFDEPTSEMDPENTEAFFGALPKALEGKTIIYVSHHFATLRQADRIIVLDHGKVVEDGPHDALMEKDGRYAELFRKQAKSYQ